MICDVLTDDDPRLLKISHEVLKTEFNTDELEQLIVNMYDTMKYRDGVGISAVQIGELKRIVLIEYDSSNSRYQDIGNCALHVMINPQIKVVGTEFTEYNEGCLSVIGKRLMIRRPKCVEYSYLDQNGKLVTGVSDNFFARVLQHEVDHLNGILFPMRFKEKIDL